MVVRHSRDISGASPFLPAHLQLGEVINQGQGLSALMARIYTDDPTTSSIIKKKRVILNIKEDSDVSYDEENLPDQVNFKAPDFHSAIFKIFDENEEFIANKA